MTHSALAAFITVVGIGCLAPVPGFGQNPTPADADAVEAWTLPRTPDGRPDLQGYWTTQTFTPLERPEHLATQEFFSEEETAALQQQLTAAGVDPSAREILYLEDREEIERYKYQAQRTPDERHHIHYDNEIWLRTAVPKGLSSRRTSLISYPPDGRFPPLTPTAAARRAAETTASQQPSAFDSHHTKYKEKK
jgi:hypothetical protein